MENITNKVENGGTTEDGRLSANEYNNHKNELQNIVARAGRPFNASSETQLSESVIIHGSAATSMAVGGTANALILTPIRGGTGPVLPLTYGSFEGLKIRFRPTTANTAQTVTIDIGQTTGSLLGIKDLLLGDQTLLPEGAISQVRYVEAVYSSTAAGGSGAWLIISSIPATGSIHGLARRASQAEVDAGTAEEPFITPETLSGRTATETRTGVARRATQAEVNAGTETEPFITPETLSGRTATETRTGVARVATQAEANAGTGSDTIVTPVTLHNRTATTTRAGIVERATQTEVNDGADTTRYVTPDTLSGRTATETRHGIVQRATLAEVVAGNDSEKYITPLTLTGRVATETQTGLAQRATPAEVALGLDLAKFITPNSLLSRTTSETRVGLVELASTTETATGDDNTRAVTPSKIRLNVETWSTPSLANGWVFPTVNPLRYTRVDSRRTLLILGRVDGASATGTTVFTLPSAFRPTVGGAAILEPAHSDASTDGVVGIGINTDGDVFISKLLGAVPVGTIAVNFSIIIATPW